jgi:ABC-2 type transport system permease protein
MVAREAAHESQVKVSRFARLWGNLRHDLSIYWLSYRVQLRAAAMLRGALITQIIGMILNNSCFLIAWLLFFNYFGTVNGWSATDYVGMMGMNALVYGLVFTFVVGLMDIPRHVDAGSLDSFLTKPTSVLGNLASSKVDVTTFGDLIFGLSLVVWYAFHIDVGFGSLLMFLLAMTSACVIFFCFAALLPNMLAFYVFDSEKLSRYAGILFLDAGLYPTGILHGPLRVVLLVGVPSLLFAAIPIDVMRGLRWEWVGLGALVATFWLAVTLWLFKRSLRKYESANLIGAR